MAIDTSQTLGAKRFIWLLLVVLGLTFLHAGAKSLAAPAPGIGLWNWRIGAFLVIALVLFEAYRVREALRPFPVSGSRSKVRAAGGMSEGNGGNGGEGEDGAA